MTKLILAIAGGLLTGLSFNSPKLSFFVWFSLLPFFYLLDKAKLRRGIIYSFLFGFTYYLTAIFWIGNVTKLGLIFLLSYLSVYAVIFFFAGRFFLKRPLAIVTLPLLWVALEFIKENVWCGFGWANLGYSQYRNLHLVQISDIFGTKSISFLIVAVNFLIYEAGIKQKFVLKKIIFIALIFILCFSYSFYRLQTLKSSGQLEVSLIQPNIAQKLKWYKGAAPYIKERLKLLSKETKRDVLTIFPEASWPDVLDDRNFDWLETFVKTIKRDVLIGAVGRAQGKNYNLAMFFDREGNLKTSYRKIKLVPFGEYIPLRKYLKFINVINLIGDISRGKIDQTFSYQDKKFSVLICFEDIFPRFVSRLSRNKDFLVNITNDAWFGGNPQANQHLGIMAMRAIENRISIVRCANSGISGWVSFKGEISKLTKGEKDVLFAGIGNYNILSNQRRSLYNRWGEFFPLLGILFLLGFAAIKARE